MSKIRDLMIEAAIFAAVWIPAVLVPQALFGIDSELSLTMTYGFVVGVAASFFSRLPAKWKLEKQKYQ